MWALEQEAERNGLVINPLDCPLKARSENSIFCLFSYIFGLLYGLWSILNLIFYKNLIFSPFRKKNLRKSLADFPLRGGAYNDDDEQEEGENFRLEKIQ